MIRGLLKHGVGLLIALGMLAGEALSISQPSLAQTAQCSAQQIENNIENLLTNPTLVDTLAACGSDSLPVLLRYLDQSNRADRADRFYTAEDKKELEKLDYQRLLIVTAIGQMGSRASSATRDLAKRVRPVVDRSKLTVIRLRDSSSGLVFLPRIQDFDKVLVYTLWQIDGDPARDLAEIAVDAKESLSARQSALYNLQGFARDYVNLIPGGINPAALEQTTNGTLVKIALDSNSDLNFRLSAFKDLKKGSGATETLAAIQNTITETLLEVIQNQAKKPEEQVDAVDKLSYLYSMILKTSIQPGYAQIITPILSQIILKTSNTGDVRHDALLLLNNFDSALAKKIAKEVSLPPDYGTADLDPPRFRAMTVAKLKAAPPAVCRYPIIQTVFAWKCR